MRRNVNFNIVLTIIAIGGILTEIRAIVNLLENRGQTGFQVVARVSTVCWNVSVPRNNIILRINMYMYINVF